MNIISKTVKGVHISREGKNLIFKIPATMRGKRFNQWRNTNGYQINQASIQLTLF